jgi:phosphoribosyl 1,2-cyclic phosphodiesterase
MVAGRMMLVEMTGACHSCERFIEFFHAGHNVCAVLGCSREHSMSGPNTVRYGGNTSCVEVRCGDHRLVFDAGSGLRALGLALADDAGPTDIDLFLSHCHIDHLIGLPFFVPAFVKGNHLRLWAGNLKAAGGVRETVRADELSAVPNRDRSGAGQDRV